MAQIFSTLKNIQRLKVKPTEGELFLVKYLIHNLYNDIEIYFQYKLSLKDKINDIYEEIPIYGALKVHQQLL